jgi:hypothetical protein
MPAPTKAAGATAGDHRDAAGHGRVGTLDEQGLGAHLDDVGVGQAEGVDRLVHEVGRIVQELLHVISLDGWTLLILPACRGSHGRRDTPLTHSHPPGGRTTPCP